MLRTTGVSVVGFGLGTGSAAAVVDAGGEDGTLANYSPVLVDRDTVYFGVDDALTALSLSGDRRWETVLDGGFVQGTPVAASGTVFVSTYRGVFAVSTETGAVEWERLDGRYGNASPAVGSGVVAVASRQGFRRNGDVFALDADDGSLRWGFETEGMLPSPVALDDGTVFVGDTDGYVYAIDADGTTSWRRQLDSHVESAPTPLGDRVVVQTRSGAAYGLDRADGSVEWQAAFGDAGRASGVSMADAVALPGDASVSAVDPRSGAEQWRVATDGRVTGLDASGGHVTYGTERGEIGAITASNGTIVQRLGTPMEYHGNMLLQGVAGTPVLHRGTLYATVDAGRLDATAVERGGDA